MQVTIPLLFQAHHNVKHLNQMFLLFGSHALVGNCYRSIWAPFLMTCLTGHHLQDQWSRVYHSLSFQFLHALRQETKQIKQEFHQAKVSMVWSLLYSIWELTNTGSKGPKCVSYVGIPMQGCSCKALSDIHNCIGHIGSEILIVLESPPGYFLLEEFTCVKLRIQVSIWHLHDWKHVLPIFGKLLIEKQPTVHL